MPALNLDKNYKHKEDTPYQPTREFKTPEELDMGTIYNKEHSLDSIIQHIRGMPWEVCYYLQVTNLNDEIATPDIATPVTSQQYHKINKLILHVQSPIEHAEVESIQGEAIINSGFLPRQGDVFIANLTGGMVAMFDIREVNHRKYNLKQAYYVTFNLFCMVNDSAEIYNNLEKKVIKEYTYNKDFLLDYSAPIILQADYDKKLLLQKEQPKLLDYYIRMFLHPTENIFSLPTRYSHYVDTLLYSFLFKIINYTDNNRLSKVVQLSNDKKETIPYTIWDAIINRDINLLELCTTNLDFKYTPYSITDLNARTMSVIGINFQVDIVDKDYKVDIPIKDISKPLPEEHKDLKLINKETEISYVFSNSFYKQDLSTCGLLEQMVIAYLKNSMVDLDSLDILLKTYPMWSTRDQYYCIPILMVILEDAIHNTYKEV